MKTTVSFQGPQGSGKTVLSRAFRKFLSARGVPVTPLDPDDRRDAADNFSVEVETDDLLIRLEALQAQPARGAISVALAPIYARIAVARENAAYNGSYAGGDAAASAKRLLDEASEAIFAALTASPPVAGTTDE